MANKTITRNYTQLIKVLSKAVSGVHKNMDVECTFEILFYGTDLSKIIFTIKYTGAGFTYRSQMNTDEAFKIIEEQGTEEAIADLEASLIFASFEELQKEFHTNIKITLDKK